MCNTFVTEFPDGSEEGDFLSMDLGGTNLRILLARLKSGKEPEYRVEPYDIDIKYRRGKPEVVNKMLISFSIKFQQKNHDLIEIKIFL
jgi:hexokinase